MNNLPRKITIFNGKGEEELYLEGHLPIPIKKVMEYNMEIDRAIKQAFLNHEKKN